MAQTHEMAELARLVRARDYDRFLVIQTAPVAKRPALLALTAFHSELARIPRIVSDSLLGTIRFTWWREALEEIAAGKPSRRHPVVQALAVLHGERPDIFAQLFVLVEVQQSALLEDNEAFGSAGQLHFAWACLIDAEAAESQKTRLFAEAELYEWLDFFAKGGFGEKDSTIRFHDFLTKQGVGVKELLGFLNEEVPREAMLSAGLRALKPAIKATQKSWPEPLQILGALAVMMRCNAAVLLRCRRIENYDGRPIASVRKILALLYFALSPTT